MRLTDGGGRMRDSWREEAESVAIEQQIAVGDLLAAARFVRTYVT